MLSESEVITILDEEGLNPYELIRGAQPLEEGLYEIAYETLEIDFNEERILAELEDAGFPVQESWYESPADNGYDDDPTDVFPYFYVTIEID